MSSTDIPTPPKIKAGKYKHYKGMQYEVLGVALHSESLEPVVIYKPLYKSVSEFWVRPYDMFVETVVVNGKTIPRFEKVDD